MSSRAARPASGPTRRAVLLGAAAFISIGLLGAARTIPSTPAILAATLRRTLVLGPADARGFRRHVIAGGEPWVVRTELAAAGDDRMAKRRPIAAFARFTDMHV